MKRTIVSIAVVLVIGLGLAQTVKSSAPKQSQAVGQAETNGAVIEGVVMEESYAVIPTLNILLVGKQNYETVSDRKGNFRFTNVVEGDYTLQPAKPDWAVACKMKRLQIRGKVMMHVDLVVRDNRPGIPHVVRPDNER
jgi:hypothetical protein